MASFRITIECENAAFVDNGPGIEVARILQQVAENVKEQMPMDGLERMVRDENGNTVGFWDYV